MHSLSILTQPDKGYCSRSTKAKVLIHQEEISTWKIINREQHSVLKIFTLTHMVGEHVRSLHPQPLSAPFPFPPPPPPPPPPPASPPTSFCPPPPPTPMSPGGGGGGGGGGEATCTNLHMTPQFFCVDEGRGTACCTGAGWRAE